MVHFNPLLRDKMCIPFPMIVMQKQKVIVGLALNLFTVP